MLYAIGATLDGAIPGQCGDNYFRYPVIRPANPITNV
jgi:hypothetical protein